MERRQLKERLDSMIVIKRNRKELVLVKSKEVRPKKYKPNYQGSTLSLCGVLKKGQTFEKFKEKWAKQNTIN